jgi:hypothetical protein
MYSVQRGKKSLLLVVLTMMLLAVSCVVRADDDVVDISEDMELGEDKPRRRNERPLLQKPLLPTLKPWCYRLWWWKMKSFKKL